MEKIAVFMSQDKGMANFYDCDYVIVFVQTEAGFETERVVTLDKIVPENPAQIRREVEKTVEIVKDCKAAAFGEISGIPFSVFDMAGFCIFSVPDYSDETLAGIFSDMEEFRKAQCEKEEMIKKARPVETQIPGVYFFDLQKVQEACPEISSKKALKEFLDTIPFMELKLVCAHIPPWLQNDARFTIKAEQKSNAVNALITLKQC